MNNPSSNTAWVAHTFRGQRDNFVPLTEAQFNVLREKILKDIINESQVDIESELDLDFSKIELTH